MLQGYTESPFTTIILPEGCFLSTSARNWAELRSERS